MGFIFGTASPNHSDAGTHGYIATTPLLQTSYHCWAAHSYMMHTYVCIIYVCMTVAWVLYVWKMAQQQIAGRCANAVWCFVRDVFLFGQYVCVPHAHTLTHTHMAGHTRACIVHASAFGQHGSVHGHELFHYPKWMSRFARITHFIRLSLCAYTFTYTHTHWNTHTDTHSHADGDNICRRSVSVNTLHPKKKSRIYMARTSV